MKKYILSLILFLFVSFNANAGLLPFGGYYGIRGGVSMQDNDIKDFAGSVEIKNKDSYFASANVGIRFLKFRGELEYTLRPETTKIVSLIMNDPITAHNIIGNLYYNFLEIPLLKLYVNGGVGETKFSGPSNIESKNNFTWAAGFGVNFSLLDIINLDVGYRYVDMGELKFTSGEIKDKQSHDIYVGVRFGF